MAERCRGHHFCRDRRHPVRAASRPGLRHSHRVYDRDRPHRSFRRDHRIRGAAETRRPSLPSASRLALSWYPPARGMAQPWQTAMFTAMAANFVPLLAPSNPMTYDTAQFYNAALAIVAGVGAAAVSFRLIPPLSPAFRARRLLALTLRDLRRLATGPIPRTPDDWEGRMYGRFAALPDQAQPLQRSQLMAAFSVGSKIIQLRRIARRLNLGCALDAALEAVARPECARDRAPAQSIEMLAARPDDARGSSGARPHPCNIGGAHPT